MSLTPGAPAAAGSKASTDILRRALATAMVVPVTPYRADGSADNVSVVKEALARLGLCRADVRPPGRPLPANIKEDISGILTAWGMR